MEFWGVEVKAGEPVKVDPQDFDAYIHLSQAALGETKKDKGAEPVVLYLKFDDQKFVLGTLSKDSFPQISFDLVLEKEFELSHNSKNVSVFFCGYKAELPDEEGDDFDNLSDSDEDAELPVITKDNGKLDAKSGLAKLAASKKSDASANDSKKQGKVEPKNEDDDSEDDEDDESDEDGEDGSSDEDMMEADSDSDEESDDDEDEEETPKKVDLSKKRPNDSASKTPVSAKKAKSGTPEKNDAKKGGHTATPHPMKKGGKTPNSEAKEPKSGGQLSCKSCSKTFNSEGGLQQHKKAKHGGQ
ncbi:histone deacetylase HDT1-like [Neltuma alba]|uniref:histone deacetylase HDT1-like n=1 Tax=Neltuma alba TaxID=207710 RepID=UPI0010A48C46|nr:histone deacetylase HDT1-like [Prosopis alba]XP_028788599.1 histone deacetylase HDT1-like [Prosopis alba]